ncbi:MAG: zinc ABC transporter substrate-binding protein [Candidatus Moranbacteria bacterium]|nr:zinc ABC transporter substrate-binding protein [Candidatus Moranbacteria bacterium]
MKRPLLILSTILFVLFILTGAVIFRTRTQVPEGAAIRSTEATVHAVATFYPLGEFSRQVGGDRVFVSAIVPAGVEPHEYEPTPADIASIYAADVLIANGAGMDAWATKLRPDLESKGVKVIVMSQVLGFDDGLGDTGLSDDEGIDPHFWLDPKFAQREVASIRDAFTAVDVKNQDVYTENTIAYTEKLDNLDRSYSEGIAMCRTKTIVTSHNAFHYLAKRYGFEALSIVGFSPESEPSTRQLADLATLARQKNIRYIFFETLVSPRLAQTLADEIGAEVLVFDPLEGLTDEDIAQGRDYLSVMYENLHNLQLAMDCYAQ